GRQDAVRGRQHDRRRDEDARAKDLPLKKERDGGRVVVVGLAVDDRFFDRADRRLVRGILRPGLARASRRREGDEEREREEPDRVFSPAVHLLLSTSRRRESSWSCSR